LCISLDFYDEICFSDNKIIELKLTLFYNQIQLQTFRPSFYSVLVTSFPFIVLFSVDDKLFIHRTIQCWWQMFHPPYYGVLVTNFPFIVLFSVGDKLFIHGTIQCWWQTFYSSYYSMLVTNFSFNVLFSVGDKLFIQSTIQCWWQTFHPSYYAVLVTWFASIIIGYGDNILSHNFLVPRIRYRAWRCKISTYFIKENNGWHKIKTYLIIYCNYNSNPM
jgi:aryl carrier-like protein